MRTHVTTSIETAASFIRKGELVAFPTETVYGLGADALNPSAIRKIFRAKRRPADNPLIVHVSSVEQIHVLASHVSPSAQKLIGKFFPGPLTIVLPKRRHVPSLVSAGLDTIAIRMPDHAVARGLLRACGVPLVAPSANSSGKPSPTTWQAVKQDLDGRIACILKGSRTNIGLESTVVDCTGRKPLVLRTGAVPLEKLRRVIAGIRVAGNSVIDVRKSPGLRYRHYAPKASVVIVRSVRGVHPTKQDGYIGLERPARSQKFGLARSCIDPATYAFELYRFFRRCDALGIRRIYCQQIEETGIGLALMDRLRRASQR